MKIEGPRTSVLAVTPTRRCIDVETDEDPIHPARVRVDVDDSLRHAACWWKPGGTHDPGWPDLHDACWRAGHVRRFQRVALSTCHQRFAVPTQRAMRLGR